MPRLVFVLSVLLLFAPVLGFWMNARPTPEQAASGSPSAPEDGRLDTSRTEPSASRPPPYAAAAEDSAMAAAAEIAWRYVEREYQSRTGLVNSVISYPYATAWDMGSTLAALYAAHELDLLTRVDFDQRMSRSLATLQGLPLFADVAFNKNYHIVRAAAAGRNDREMDRGYGWSTTDIGRLLIWLKIVEAAHPQHAAAVREIVDRLDFEPMIRDDGYLWGGSLNADGLLHQYQEGRIAYEQYAALGFALWGYRAEQALDFTVNAVPLEVLGVPLQSDVRPGAFLTGEPLYLMGMEVGWPSPAVESFAKQLLAVQKRRWEETGQVTILSEDAIPVEPDYFYYYTVHHDGEDFAIRSLTQRPTSVSPWVSAKGAWGWYALLPSEYTWRALEATRPAADPRTGWHSGVYEESGLPTGSQNINTAGVILTSILYKRLGVSILHAAEKTRETTD